jgi:hypothetical protein
VTTLDNNKHPSKLSAFKTPLSGLLVTQYVDEDDIASRVAGSQATRTTDYSINVYEITRGINFKMPNYLIC